jgi:hypothetical protein
MMKTNYLEASPGNKSNSRRIAWCAFWSGLVFAQQIMLAGLYVYFTTPATATRPDLLGIAGAAASIFAAIAGSAMAFTFFQKTQEPKITTNETPSIPTADQSAVQ